MVNTSLGQTKSASCYCATHGSLTISPAGNNLVLGPSSIKRSEVCLLLPGVQCVSILHGHVACAGTYMAASHPQVTAPKEAEFAECAHGWCAEGADAAGGSNETLERHATDVQLGTF